MYVCVCVCVCVCVRECVSVCVFVCQERDLDLQKGWLPFAFTLNQLERVPSRNKHAHLDRNFNRETLQMVDRIPQLNGVHQMVQNTGRH